jgi:hypothetical protein
MNIFNKPKLIGILLIISSIIPGCQTLFAPFFWLFIVLGIIFLFVKETHWISYKIICVFALFLIALSLFVTYGCLKEMRWI